jgi:translocation and assembly module TamA
MRRRSWWACAAALLIAWMPLPSPAQDVPMPAQTDRDGAVAPAAPASAPLPAAPASAPISDEERARRAAARAARNAPMQPNWRLVINAPRPLRVLLERYLDVARFRSQLSEESTTLTELGRLVAAAPAQARSLLDAEGYFNAKVNAQLLSGEAATQALDAAESSADVADEPVATAETPVVRIDVEPGPLATVDRVTIEVQGELQSRAEAGDAAASALLASLRNEWPLKPGRAFRQTDWTAAKNSTLARLRADAYPLANWAGTAAQIDPSTHRVRIFVVGDSGPRFLFGPLRIEGLSRYGEPAVRNLAPFAPGQPYSEKALLDFQERLAKSGLFDSVSVTIEPDLETADAAPVIVRLRELPAQQVSVGVGVSADNGPRITLEHLHRRVFGWDWQAKTKIELGSNRKLLQSDFTSHAQPGAYRNLFSAAISREIANAVTIDLQRLRLGRTQDTERIERLYYLEWQKAKTEFNGVPSGAGALTGNYEWVWRRLDSNLLPTRGLAASAKVGAGRSLLASGINAERNGWFSRATGRLTLYEPLGGNWYTQTRVEGGQVFARDNVAVPYTLLFRAGGDNSVRGYAYQSLGPPPDASGVAIGGRVLATGSFEIARPLSPRLPAWWGAAFVDAGGAAAGWTDFGVAVGVGVGLRWRSPVGPLNLDLAYGEKTRRFRLHFNVGVVF